MKNNFVKKGDWVRVCYAGSISKTLFKVACRKNSDVIIIEVDPEKNKEDKNILGWSPDSEDFEKLGLLPEKLYWNILRWERTNNKLKI